MAITEQEATKRQKAEEPFRESEERLRKIFEIASDAIVFLDGYGRIVDVNRKAVEVFGGSESELIGRHFTKIGIFSPKDLPQLLRNFRDVISGKKMVIELAIKNRKGKQIHLECSSSLVRRDDKLVGVMIIARDITERKNAEKRIRESEEKYKDLVERMPDVIYSVDNVGNITSVNRASEKLLGIVPAEIIGRNITEFVPKEALPQATLAIRQVRAGKTNAMETMVIDRHGKLHHVEFASAPIMKDGVVVGSQGIVRDITERKELEEELAQERDLFNALMDNIPDPIFFKDTESRFTRVNKTSCPGLGVKDPKDAIGMRDFDFCPEELARKFYADDQMVMRSGKPLINKEEMMIDRVGKKWHLTTKVPIKDKDGRITGLVGIARDITERKQMEEEMRIKDAAIESSINAVAFADLEGNITYVNRSFLEMWGHDDEKEVLGKPAAKSWQMEDEAQRMLEALKDRGSWMGELVTKRKDGSEMDLQLSASMIKDEMGNPVCLMASFIDITELKKAERDLIGANFSLTAQLVELERLQQELETSNQLLKESNVDLENYTYVVSHDLKAPLRAIRSFSTFLLEDYSDKLNETGQDYLERIANASSHMDALIEDLLLLSRVGRKFTDVEEVDLNLLLEEVVADLEPSVQKRNADVVFNNLPIMSVQRTWVKQMFMNLIDNGLKFNKSETPRVEVSCQEREEDYLFKVQDNGIGIEKKHFERIFNLSERLHTREEYPGTGAGLAICKKIAQHFRGKIWVESTPGKGSTFLFTMPKKMKPTTRGLQEDDT